MILNWWEIKNINMALHEGLHQKKICITFLWEK